MHFISKQAFYLSSRSQWKGNIIIGRIDSCETPIKYSYLVVAKHYFLFSFGYVPYYVMIYHAQPPVIPGDAT